jgi:hypothetical protein
MKSLMTRLSKVFKKALVEATTSPQANCHRW